MVSKQVLRVVALVLGLVALGYAYHFSQAPIEQLSDSLTGRYTDTTMNYIIGGIVAIVVGGALLVLGKRS